MRMISNKKFPSLIVFWIILTGLPALCQDQRGGSVGFVRLLNAVHLGDGALIVSADGAPVRETGYQPGDVTGGIALKPGSHLLSFERDGLKKGETRIAVKPNETTILIPFAERVPATDGQPEHLIIRVLRLKQHDPENERTATFVSVSADPETRIEVMQSGGDWEPVHVRRLALTRTGIKQSKGYLPVRHNGQPLAEISVSQTGNHVLVLYDDAQGVLRSKNFSDHKYLSAE